MSLGALPVELLRAICDHLDRERDLSAFLRTCRRFHDIFIDDLYRNVGDVIDVIRYAIQQDLEVIIRRLLAAGLDPNGSRMTPALFEAIEKGRTGVVKLLLAHGSNPHSSYIYKNKSPLHYAANFGQEDLVRFFLGEGLDPNMQSTGGWTPLLAAANWGHERIVRALLENGASAAVVDEKKDTALSLAIKGSHESLASLLVQKVPVSHLELQDERTRRTPLILAAIYGQTRIVRDLLNAGANVDQEEEQQYGCQALWYAVIKDHRDIVRMLIEAGADVNHQGRFGRAPLLGAVSRQSLELLRICIDAGADIHVPNEYGVNALVRAGQEGDLETVKLLLSVDSSAECIQIILDAAFEHSRAPLVAYLLDNGGSLEGHLEGGILPRNWGITSERRSAAMTLLMMERGYYVPEIHSEYGHPPLELAVIQGDVDTLNRLLEMGYGRDDSSGAELQHLLWMAVTEERLAVVARLLQESGLKAPGANLLRVAWRARVEIINMFLESGVDLTAADEDGTTTFLRAARDGVERVVRLLVQRGADPSVKDSNGYTALSLAAQFGHPKVVLALLEDGTAPETWTRPSLAVANFDNPPRYLEFIDTPDNLNRTPLFFATVLGHEDIVRILLSRGSNAIETPTCADRTALSFAARFRRFALADQKDYSLQFIWQWLQYPSEATVNLKATEEASSIEREIELWCGKCRTPLPLYAPHLWCLDDSHADCHYCQECLTQGAKCDDSTQALKMVISGEEGGFWEMDLVDYYNYVDS